jgi:digeranylgeranylglycerophospholipid reductase
MKTLLVDALNLPRDKLCAGGVSSWVIERLRVPDDLIERTVEHVQIVAGSKKIPIIPWPKDMAYRMVMRRDFDHFITEKARKAGAEIKDRTAVATLFRNNNGVVSGVRTSRGDFKSQLIIGCDGASSIVARTSGLWSKWWSRGDEAEGWRRHQAFCLETQMELDPQIIEQRVGNTMTLLFDKSFPGYSWIFPKRRVLTVGLASFSYLTPVKELRERLNRLIHDHPVASKLLNDAEMKSLSGAYLPIRGPLMPSYDDGVIIAGDAASQVGAVWGEGIYFAVRAGLAAGETAVDAIRKQDVSRQFLKKYEDRWRQEIGENLMTQAEILRKASTPLQATIDFAANLATNRTKLYRF